MPEQCRRSWPPPKLLAILAGTTLMIQGSMLGAQGIMGARYDPRTDTVLLDLAYRGTNANHRFSLQWDKCKQLPNGAGDQVAALLIDDEWNDRALTEYRRRIPLSLEEMPCRPAKMTLRTAAGFEITLRIPALRRFADTYELTF